MTLEQTNQDTVLSFMSAFSRGDVEQVLSMLDDSATWWVAGTMPISGLYPKAEFAKLLAGIGESCEGAIKLTPKAFTVQGERVAVETESLAHLKNGRVYNNHYHFLFNVRDGHIFEVREYLDTMHTNEIFCTP